MAVRKKESRLCTKGHAYVKSSDCPVCPVCANEARPKSGYASLLAAPARRALENAGIHTLKQLANYSETGLLQLHGMGKSSLPILRKALKEAGYNFRKSTQSIKSMAPDTNKAVDSYISRFPKKAQLAMNQLRETVRAMVPDAVETIKYGMPAYVLKKNLVFFAGYKNHIGFYPAPVKEPLFEKALSAYKTGRGSIQFPLDKPMPLALVKKIVNYYRKKQSAEK